MKLFPSKRTVKRFAFGCTLLVGVLLVVNAFMSWRVQRQADALIAEIRAAGDPATLADLKPAPIPDEENAAYWLVQARGQLSRFSKDYAEFCDGPLGKAYDDLQESERPTGEVLTEIRKILDRHPQLTAEITRIAKCEQYASQSAFTDDAEQIAGKSLAPLISAATRDARIITWRQGWVIDSLCESGEHDQALVRGTELLRFARLYDCEPLMVNHLVAMAIYDCGAKWSGDSLINGKISLASRDALERELAQSVPLSGLIRAFKTERAFVMSRSNPECLFFGINGDNQPSVVNKTFINLFGWKVKNNLLGPGRFIGKVISMLESEPIHFPTLSKRLDALSKGEGTISQLTSPMVLAAIESHCRAVAKTRAVRVVSALQRFEEEAGRAATGLVDLDLPQDATIDPYTGDPLKLKHTEHGWLVYSVGKNGVDDGGMLHEYQDIGYAPPAVRLEQSKKQ